MSTWLDTETKVLLRGAPGEPVSVDLCDYCLVVTLLADEEFLNQRALGRIGSDLSLADITSALNEGGGVVAKDGLTVEGALMAQFELICANSHSVFLDAEVVKAGGRPYLESLLGRLSKSDEFRLTRVAVTEAPRNQQAVRFLDQFFGVQDPGLVLNRAMGMPWKKARIMRHWAERHGVSVELSPL